MIMDAACFIVAELEFSDTTGWPLFYCHGILHLRYHTGKILIKSIFLTHKKKFQKINMIDMLKKYCEFLFFEFYFIFFASGRYFWYGCP